MRAVAALLIAALLPLAAEAKVLDTLETASDSTDYEVETCFVKVDSASFFKPHSGEEAVRNLIDRKGRGRCRVITVVRAVNQRRADEFVKRYDGEDQHSSHRSLRAASPCAIGRADLDAKAKIGPQRLQTSISENRLTVC